MKWHQAHTTWFFETFVLRPFLADYKPFRDEFRWLFNSYYISIGEEVPEGKQCASFSAHPLNRSLIFASTLTRRWREAVCGGLSMTICSRRIVLGLNHQQQHQELALTDIKHAFFSNPLRPSFTIRLG